MNTTTNPVVVNFGNIFSRMRMYGIIIRTTKDIKIIRNSKIAVVEDEYVRMGITITDNVNKTMLSVNDMPHSRIAKRLLYNCWLAGIGLYIEGMMRKGINHICPHLEKDILKRDIAMTEYGHWNVNN